MNKITNEQREAIVRKAIAERDALLSAQQPAIVMGEAIENAHSAPCETAKPVVSNEPDEKNAASVGGASAQVQGDGDERS